jgi:hypothetical protein
MGKIYLIDEELATNIIQYLSDKPYRDVYKLIDGLKSINEIPTYPIESFIDNDTKTDE